MKKTQNKGYAAFKVIQDKQTDGQLSHR